jgi:hypothetical protein
VALLGRLHGLGRELRGGRHVGDDGPNGILLGRVEHDARLRAQADLAGDLLGQEDVHVDVGQIEQREDPAAGGHHLAGLGQAGLHPAADRRDQHRVGDLGPQPVGRGPGRVDRRTGPCTTSAWAPVSWAWPDSMLAVSVSASRLLTAPVLTSCLERVFCKAAKLYSARRTATWAVATRRASSAAEI